MKRLLKKLIYSVFIFLFITGMSTSCTKAATPKLDNTYVAVAIQENTTVSLNGVSTKASIVSDASLKKKKKTKKVIYWAVKNPVTASITASKNKVTITGQKDGTTTVKAKYNGKTYSIAVRVHTPEESISAKPVDLTLTKEIPSYWKNELDDSASRANGRIEKGVANFFYITDTHWGANTKNSPAMIDLLSDKLGIPLTICGGDVINGTYENSKEGQAELESFYNAFKNVKIFSAIGNHDKNSHSKSVPASAHLKNSLVYDIMLEQVEDFGTTSKNLNYAYTDDTDNKVRYISFYYDQTHPSVYTKATEKWIDKRVKELNKDWTVILISHAYWKYAKAGKSCKVPAKSSDIAKHMLSLQKNSKATIAAWMVGHNHRDMSTTLTDVSGTNRLNIISTNCDAFEKSEIQGGITMKKGTTSEQAFDIVQIDTIKKRLHMIRVGAGEDRDFYY